MCPVHKCLMRGPFTVRHGETHNFGRQFFVPPKRSRGRGELRPDGFKWADGTTRCLPHAVVPKPSMASGDTVGVGCSTPMGVKEGDEMRRGPSGYLDPARGGRLVTGQPSGSRRPRRHRQRRQNARALAIPMRSVPSCSRNATARILPLFTTRRRLRGSRPILLGPVASMA